MTRSERLVAIMQSLRARRGPTTAATLAGEFAVSERTIYRDIAVLVARGAVIEGAAGLGFVIARGHFLPPLMFEPDEVDAIMLGLRYVMRRGDAALGTAGRSALAKIAAVIPADVEQRAGLNGLLVGPASSAPEELISLVRTSIARERKLVFDYTDGRGARSQRCAWPVVLGFFDDCEMMAAWCEARGAFRHFRLDRMTGCRATEAPLPVARRRLLADYRKVEPRIDW